MELEHAKQDLDRYAQTGQPLGHFLTAVLENDLMGAMGHADETSRANLFEICRYVYNVLPRGCWGSAANVRAWTQRHQEDPEEEEPWLRLSENGFEPADDKGDDDA